MSHKIEKNENNKVTLLLTIPKDEVEAGMKHAAEHMAEDTKIDGFRPGKANYEVIKKRVGEMKLLETAAEELIRNAFVKAMLEEDLETVGQPYFDVEKMVPGNDLVVRVTVALFPHVLDLADYQSLKVEKKSTEATDEMLERAKKDLALMQTKEIRAAKDHALTQGDKTILNMTMKKDGVVIEGGEGQDHGVYTGEGHYVEGFIDQILGLKEGDTKTFTLKFPKEHYQKNIAGEDVEFTVEIKEIFELEAPKIDDAFAKTVGLKDAAELDAKLRENIQRENEVEEQMRLDKACLDLIAEKSKFEEIPDLLINQEVEKMLHELKHQLTQQGMEFEAYLKQIGKSLADLKIDFTPTGLRRVEVAILLKEIVKNEGITVDDKEIDSELDKLAAQYEDEETKKRVYEPMYRDYVKNQLLNRKTIERLKSIMVK